MPFTWKPAALLAAAALLSYPLPAHAAPVMLKAAFASLWGTQEVPPIFGSPASGAASISLWQNDDGSHFIVYEMRIRGIDFSAAVDGDPMTVPTDPLDATGLHFHVGSRDVNGPIIFGLFNPDHDFNDNTVYFNQGADGWLIRGQWDPGEGNPAQPFGNVEAAAAALLATENGDDTPFYVNAHTVRNPRGEIRGQLVAVPEAATLGLFGAGLSFLLATRRRKSPAEQVA